jgi:hypothetical protein
MGEDYSPDDASQSPQDPYAQPAQPDAGSSQPGYGPQSDAGREHPQGAPPPPPLPTNRPPGPPPGFDQHAAADPYGPYGQPQIIVQRSGFPTWATCLII